MFPLYTLDTSFTPAQEKDVLLDIYSSTNGKQWYQTSGRNSSHNNTSHCTSYGITCHNAFGIPTSMVFQIKPRCFRAVYD